MATGQSIKEHLKAFNDQVKAAGEKQDEQAKAAIKSAMGHLEAAQRELDAHVKSNAAQDNDTRQVMRQHLQTALQNSNEALKEKGANLRKSIRGALDATDFILTKQDF